MMPLFGPIDGALALSVGARRAVQRVRRHLLPGAPLGAPGRRRAPRPAAWNGGHPFSWRAPQPRGAPPPPVPAKIAAPPPARPAPQAVATRTHEVHTERVVRESVRVMRHVATGATPAPVAAATTPPAARGRQPVPVVMPASAAPPSVLTPGDPPLVARRLTAIETPQAPGRTDRREGDVSGLPSSPGDSARAAAAAAAREFAVAPTLVWFSPAAVGVRRRTGSESRAVPVAPGAARGAPTPSPRFPTLPALLTFAPARAGGTSNEPGVVWEPSLPPLVVSEITAGPARKVLAVVSEVLERGVAARVREEVAQAMKRVDSARPAPASATQSSQTPSAPVRVDDRLAGAMIDRIRGLLREERFRHGLLR